MSNQSTTQVLNKVLIEVGDISGVLAVGTAQVSREYEDADGRPHSDRERPI